jgi:hypothetical protein
MDSSPKSDNFKVPKLENWKKLGKIYPEIRKNRGYSLRTITGIGANEIDVSPRNHKNSK